MLRRLRRLAGLAPEERRALALGLLLVPVAVVLVRLLGYGGAKGVLARTPLRAPADVSPAALSRWVDAAARLLGAGCLPRSLVLWRLLRERGATLRFGVARPAPQGLRAHAWVELDGEALAESPAALLAWQAFPARQAAQACRSS